MPNRKKRISFPIYTVFSMSYQFPRLYLYMHIVECVWQSDSGHAIEIHIQHWILSTRVWQTIDYLILEPNVCKKSRTRYNVVDVRIDSVLLLAKGEFYNWCQKWDRPRIGVRRGIVTWKYSLYTYLTAVKKLILVCRLNWWHWGIVYPDFWTWSGLLVPGPEMATELMLEVGLILKLC